MPILDLEDWGMLQAALQVRPHRVRRCRGKGWRMPANTVYVGRPTRWGNPWVVGGSVSCGCRSVGECTHNYFQRNTPAEAVEAFRCWAATHPAVLALEELRGRNLACWCPLDQPCHADVLLELANG